MHDPGSIEHAGDAGRLPVSRADNAGRGLSRLPSPAAFPLELQQPARDLSDEPIDLMGYWRVLRKHRWLILSTLAAVVLATAVMTLLSTPIYRATTSLQIDREALKVVDFEGDQRPVENGSGNDFYQTQYELLHSRALAQRVVSQTGMLKDPAYQRMHGGSTLSRLLGRDDGNASAPARGAVAVSAANRAAVDTLLNAMTIEPVRNSRLVRVNVDGPDPVLAARLANAVADGFIASTLERRFDASTYAKNYLEDRLQQLKVKLEDSERELVRFAEKERIVNGTEGQSLSGQNLGELNTSLAQAQAQRIRAEARWNQARGAMGANLPADMLAGSIVRTLQERRAQLMAQYQDNLRVYKPAYPSMLQMKSQIDEVDKQIANELVSIRASVKAEYDAALAQEHLLTGKMGEVRNDVLDLQNRSIRYNILKREVDTNRQLYDGLLQRYKEIGVAGGVSTNNVSVVDRAEVPMSRFKPSLSSNLGMALLGGLLLGIALAFLLEHLDDTVRGSEQVESLFNLPVLGTVPMLKHQQNPLQASADLRSAFAESYRSVRTALQFSTDAGVPRTLLVTSATPGEGKTTTALLLARNFAQLGQRVLLIDADLRNPSLHKLLKLGAEAGLSNYLAGAMPAVEVIQPGGDENLWIIRSGPLPPNPAELLASHKMKSLLDLAADRYDQVILDGPPVMGLADAPILAHLASGTLLMVASGKTRRALLRAALKRLAAARSRVIGGVVTMYDSRRAGLNYGYGDYGYYEYGVDPGKALPAR